MSYYLQQNFFCAANNTEGYLDSLQIISIHSINATQGRNIYKMAKRSKTLINFSGTQKTLSVLLLNNGYVAASPLSPLKITNNIRKAYLKLINEMTFANNKFQKIVMARTDKPEFYEREDDVQQDLKSKQWILATADDVTRMIDQGLISKDSICGFLAHKNNDIDSSIAVTADIANDVKGELE